MDMDSAWDFTKNNFSKVWILSLLVLKLVEGQSLVAGPSQPIVAVIGDDIVLPCYLVPPRNVAELTVEWSRPDLKPNPKDGLNRKYVYLYRDGREMTAMKNPLYFGRTVLRKHGLTTGNMSLKLTNVTLSDNGSYRCFIPKLRGQMKEHVIRIVVVEAQPTTAPNNLRTEAPTRSTLNLHYNNTDLQGVSTGVIAAVVVITSVLVIILLIIMGYIYMRHRRKHQQPNPTLSSKKNRMLESSSKQTDTMLEEKHLTSSSSLVSAC